MKINLLLLSLVYIQNIALAQIQKEPVEVTPSIQQKIKKEVASEVQLLKAKLQKNKINDMEIEFGLDTFRIEKIEGKYIDYDWTTAGMRAASYVSAASYDSLLNKYYRKLLNVLKGGDKDVLIAAQKAWINFRDKEFKLVETISKDEYSGGGTAQQLNESGTYLEMVKMRVVTIFQHLQRATQQ